MHRLHLRRGALFAFIGAMTCAGVASGGPFEDATAAHRRGDYATALRLLQPLATAGDAAAEYNLGVMFSAGQGVPQSYADAAKWYRKSAEQGFDQAQTNLGFLYAEGRGVEQDYVEAVKWYRKAADQGFAVAQFNLGSMYADGRGVPQDYYEASQWYRKAADTGLADAQYSLGTLFANGDGVTQDYVESYKWLMLASSRYLTVDADKRSKAAAARNAVAGKMTPEQITQAQKAAREWQPLRNGQAVPTKR